MSETLDGNGGAGTRPVFLSVVCILSFVGIGFAIIGYVGAFALLGVAEGAMDQLSTMAEDAGGTVTGGASTGILWAYIIIGFITAIVSLMGVIKMWKLQKAGFMMYTGAAIVGLIMGIVYIGFSASMMSILFTAAFIVMYGVNLKHMK
ncbi:MAG: hypothetical protein QNK23_10265 [Crocinitomicaceae bacterium]|nr:hypothetical protein [Crocinitomicaceae bacterium]